MELGKNTWVRTFNIRNKFEFVLGLDFSYPFLLFKKTPIYPKYATIYNVIHRKLGKYHSALHISTKQKHCLTKDFNLCNAFFTIKNIRIKRF